MSRTDVFWTGTPQQFYSLYEKTARALKSVDPSLKVGGDAIAQPALTTVLTARAFIDYCAAHQVPLDFYSWHTYANSSADPYDAVRLAREIRRVLDAHGFPKAESILSEWNLSADFTEKERAELEGMHNAAYIGAVLSYFQDAPLDHAHVLSRRRGLDGTYSTCKGGISRRPMRSRPWAR